MQNACNDSKQNNCWGASCHSSESPFSWSNRILSAHKFTQEIWEYKEIKNCFCPSTHFTTRTPRPRGFYAAHMLILWLLLLSPATGTAKQMPSFPSCLWTGYTSVEQNSKLPNPPCRWMCFSHYFSSMTLLVSQPLVQEHMGKATAKWRSCKAAAVPGGKVLLHWMNGKCTHLQAVAVTSSSSLS